MAEKKSGPFTLLKAVPLVLLAFIILIPLSIYFILSMGFPPVVGNLAAAQSIRKYAAQVYPEWEPQGIWAGYNLVTDGYYLTFSNGEEKYTLDYAWPEDGWKIRHGKRRCSRRQSWIGPSGPTDSGSRIG